MKTISKSLVSRGFFFFGLFFGSASLQAKSTDMGICFLKTDKQTIQSKINEIAIDGQTNMRIQQQVRFFNDLTNLFVPVDTYNYKMFWVHTPNNDWLVKNCFKFGYITLMDYNRRAITRVFSSPTQVVQNSRMPANARSSVPQADPPIRFLAETPQEYVTPFDPEEAVAPPVQVQQTPTPAPVPQLIQPQQQMIPINPGYGIPQINLYNNFYGPGQMPAVDSSVPPKKPEIVDETLSSNEKDKKNTFFKDENSKKDRKEKSESDGEVSVFDSPSYMQKPSYFFELSPFMGYENTSNHGGGVINKFSIFSYGTDLKVGYRFNQYFNYYFKGRYANLEARSVKAPAVLALNENSDISYGLGAEHVASRFLSLAIEYNALHVQSFEQVGSPTNVVNVRENVQTVNVDFKLNFISKDDFKLGLQGNYGIVIADNSEELIYDFKTKLYLFRVFDSDYFGLNLGYEQNKFLYATGVTSETTRKRFVFGLNYGFDL